MIHRGVKIAYFETYRGTRWERKERLGLNYDYMIRLRDNQMERMNQERIGQKQKEERVRLRKQFLMQNLINQRCLMSLQAGYLGVDTRILLRYYYSSQAPMDSLNVFSESKYSSKDSKAYYLKKLIKDRRERAARNEDMEFRNPLYVPLRGLDEDESDRDYMRGRELRRELRNSNEFEEAFNRYVCEREEVDNQLAESLKESGLGLMKLTAAEMEAGIKELQLIRKEGQSDEEYFDSCLNHAWSIISQLETPDLISFKQDEKNKSNGNEIKNLDNLVEVFKLFFKDKMTTLDDSIFTIAISLQLLNINYFWTDLRDFMRDPQDNGLKSVILIAGLQSKSQLIQEALIELVYDLSFSDFEGQKVNKVLYEDCLEVVEGWLGTEKWNCQQTLSCFMELFQDFFLSQVVYNNPKKQKIQFSLNLDDSDENEEEKEDLQSDSEEEEKQMEHGMEDISQPHNLKQSEPSQGKHQIHSNPVHYNHIEDKHEISKPQLYFRKDEKFISFFCSLFNELLNNDYQLDIFKPTVQEALQKSWDSEIEQKDQNQESEEFEKEDLNPEIQEQLQLEDDGIELGSETTTECSEYSEDLIEDIDTEVMVINVLNTICFFFKDFTDQKRYSEKYYSPKDYVKNSPISIVELIRRLEDFTPKNSKDAFKNIDKYLNQNFVDMSTHTNVVLTKIKCRLFPKMNGKDQIEFLNKEQSNWTMTNNLEINEFADDFVIQILRSGVRNVPFIDIITSQGNKGLWGSFFYSRPPIQPGSCPDQEYREPKWVSQSKNYERVVDEIHRILTQDRECAQRLASYLARNNNAKKFSYFIRNILKPEIGSLLKTVKLTNLKREDFKPFKVDRGYRVVEAELKDLEFGDHVYQCSSKYLENEENVRIDSLQFYIKNRNSIYSETTLEKTREELEYYPDRYRLFLGEINALQGVLDDEVGEVGQANQEAADRLRRNREAADNKKKGNGNQPAPQKKYLLKKESILSFRARSATKLIREERYEKVENKVSTDLLRSGSAMLRKLIYRDRASERATATFIRKPLYSMYIPQVFYNNSHPKFRRFVQQRYARDRSNNYDQPEDGSIPYKYKCLYIKRLKKVVLRANTLSARIAGLDNMLAHQKVTCKDEVINFDKPEQRDVYFGRLFELVSFFDKKNETVRFFNADDNTLPARSMKTYYHNLLDYTTRTKGIIKSNFLAQELADYANYPWHIVDKQGAEITQVSKDLNIKKTMRKGQRSSYEFFDQFDEDVVSFKVFDKLSTGVSTLDSTFSSTSQSFWSTNRSHGLEIHFAAVDEAGSEVTDVQSEYHTYYLEKNVDFQRVKTEGEGDEEKSYFYVTKRGVKEVFRFPVQVGTRLLPHDKFERLYVLNVDEDAVRLRVISYQAFLRYITEYLKNHADK